MPTFRGWASVGAAVALFVLWLSFGDDLLLALSVLLLTSVIGGTIYVRIAGVQLTLVRTIVPEQLHDGETAVIDLRMTSRRTLNRVQIEDWVHGLGTAKFLASHMSSGEEMAARYEVLCEPRGVYRVGPMRVSVTDPLGFAESSSTAQGSDRLVVYPRVENLLGVPSGSGQDQRRSASRSSFWHTSGEDFFTLREYQRGDDLRRVHWPSTAKHDELMIKQLEMPWQSSVFIMLDPRAETHESSTSFERAVSGAASVLHHLVESGYTPTIWAGNGNGTTVGDTEAYHHAMEELATITPHTSFDMRHLVEKLQRNGASGGTLILVTGALGEDDSASLRVLSQGFYRTVLLSVESTESREESEFARVGTLVIGTTPNGEWATPWRNAMEHPWPIASVG